MKITFKHKGDFKKTHKFLSNAKDAIKLRQLEMYAEEGLSALRSATPYDTGRTADSWYYEIERTRDGATISYKNSYIQNGVQIAVILQYGHGTGTGGYVYGRDYINPALQPVFDKLAQDAWEEVTKT